MYGLLDEKGARRLGRVERGRQSRSYRELIRVEGKVEMSFLAFCMRFLFCEAGVERCGVSGTLEGGVAFSGVNSLKRLTL